jgi:shikimate kinase
MDYMLKQGQTVYLKCDNDTLLRRLKVARSQRPLIASKSDEELAAFIETETRRREPGYLRAEYICPGDRLESRDQISDTITYLKQLLDLKKD